MSKNKFLINQKIICEKFIFHDLGWRSSTATAPPSPCTFSLDRRHETVEDIVLTNVKWTVYILLVIVINNQSPAKTVKAQARPAEPGWAIHLLETVDILVSPQRFTTRVGRTIWQTILLQPPCTSVLPPAWKPLVKWYFGSTDGNSHDWFWRVVANTSLTSWRPANHFIWRPTLRAVRER